MTKIPCRTVKCYGVKIRYRANSGRKDYSLPVAPGIIFWKQ